MSWEQYLSVVAEAMAHVRAEKSEPPTACPYDGEPLDAAPDGGLFCPAGNYSWPRQARII